ncbi:MAG TPA: transposase [Streptosporangiaceae bacterium]
MQPVPWPEPEPDPQVAAAIAAMYGVRKTKRPLAVLIRDRLGEWLEDGEFAAAFGIRGRPGWSPSRLALVTVLQRAENLTDRPAADAVRTRIDWKYLLGLPLDDPGFDHTVLAEFRGRVADAGLEQVVLDALLAKLAAGGLVKAAGKQRTGSTHVIAAVAALSRLELAGESVRAEFWLGCKLHVTETCDDPPACTCPAAEAVTAGAGGHGREHDKGCAHLVFPNLITHVATTGATVTDNQMTGPIHDDLAEKHLAPGRHYLDSGYLSAALVVAALTTWGIALTGPLLAGTSAQARAGKGYARADFTVDYHTKTVTCPQGKTARSWSPCTQHGKDAIVAIFSITTAAPARPAACAPPPSAACSRYRPPAWPKPRQPPGPQKRPSRSRPTTPAAPTSKAPCTRPPATARAGHATAACPRPASTTYTWPARSTCSGWKHSGPAPHWTADEPATWHASNPASRHDPELATRIASARSTSSSCLYPRAMSSAVVFGPEVRSRFLPSRSPISPA